MSNKYLDIDDYVEAQADGLFSIDDLYGNPPMTLVCRTCGGREFHVAIADYFTAIKCVKCGWEDCIHSG